MIIFEQAKIVANKQVTGEALSNRLSVVAELTNESAKVLNLPDTTPEWFSTAAITGEFTECEVTHELPKLGCLRLSDCKVSRFRLFREFADRLMVAFTVDYNGQPFGLTKHLTTIGAGEGKLTIKWPEQQSLIANENL